MMDAYWDLRARRSTASADPALAEFMQLEYPAETAGWLLETAESRTRPAAPRAASRPHPLWSRLMTWLGRRGDPDPTGPSRCVEDPF